MKTPCLIAASGLLLAGCTSLERPATDYTRRLVKAAFEIAA